MIIAQGTTAPPEAPLPVLLFGRRRTKRETKAQRLKRQEHNRLKAYRRRIRAAGGQAGPVRGHHG